MEAGTGCISEATWMDTGCGEVKGIQDDAGTFSFEEAGERKKNSPSLKL